MEPISNNTVSTGGLVAFKPKKNINIREVSNGFVIEAGWDNSHIAATPEEVIKAVSEILSK